MYLTRLKHIKRNSGKKANLSLNRIQKELDVLTEKKNEVKGFTRLCRKFEFFCVKILFKRKPNSDVNRTLSNEM